MKLKQWTICLAAVLCAACDKSEEPLPEWSRVLTYEEIQSYVLRSGPIDEDALLEMLASSVFCASGFNVHYVGYTWHYTGEFCYGAGEYCYLFGEQVVHASIQSSAGRSVKMLGWRYDSGRNTLIFHSPGDPSAVSSEAEICYLRDGRMILHERFFGELPKSWINGGADMRQIDNRYLVGDFTSMTREEFRACYGMPAD